MSLYLAGATTTPSFDFERFATEAKGYEGEQAIRVAQELRSAVEKLRPYSLDDILLNCRAARQFSNISSAAACAAAPVTPSATERPIHSHSLALAPPLLDSSAKKAESRHPVYETLLESPLISLGLLEHSVMEIYVSESGKRSLSLKERMAELVADFKMRASTVRGQVRVWNLFLVCVTFIFMCIHL